MPFTHRSMHPFGDGALDGRSVGTSVGDAEGAYDGEREGPVVGTKVGASVGGNVQVHPVQLWPQLVKMSHVYSGFSGNHSSQFHVPSSMGGHASAKEASSTDPTIMICFAMLFPLPRVRKSGNRYPPLPYAAVLGVRTR